MSGAAMRRCNTYGTSFTQDGSKLTFGETFEVVGDRLSLFRADGGYAVVVERS